MSTVQDTTRPEQEDLTYGDIVWMALAPALLYFLSVLLYVHVLAVKNGFQGMQGHAGAWRVLLDGLHFLLPLVLITALLLWNYSPVLVGAAGSAAVLLANHGPVVAGKSLEAAGYATEELEETAKLFLLLRGQNPRGLTPEQVEELEARFPRD